MHPHRNVCIEEIPQCSDETIMRIAVERQIELQG
jgi:hypothetical protein